MKLMLKKYKYFGWKDIVGFFSDFFVCVLFKKKMVKVFVLVTSKYQEDKFCLNLFVHFRNI